MEDDENTKSRAALDAIRDALQGLEEEDEEIARDQERVSNETLEMRRKGFRPRYKVAFDAIRHQCQEWILESEAARVHGEYQKKAGLNGDHLMNEADTRKSCARRIIALLDRFERLFGREDYSNE